MAMKAATRFSVRTDTSVFKRLGTRNHQLKTVVCKYWLEGRCTRNPCNFMHQEIDTFKSKYAWNNPNTFKSDNSPPIQPKSLNKNENSEPNQIVIKNQQTLLTSQVNVGQSQSVVENCMKVRKSELNDGQSLSIEKTDNSKYREVNVGQTQSVVNNSKYREVNVGQTQSVVEKTDNRKNSDLNVGQSQSTENCKKHKNSENLQSEEGLSMVSQLEGHTKCGNVVNFDNECRNFVKQGPWVFAGLKDMIKAWNSETQTEVIIRACGGYVNAITIFEDILFAGMEDGSILSWKVTSKTSFFEELTALKGHTGSVLCLIIGAKKLYSGSADHTIRAWDCETLECTHVLNGHTGDVTAVICWDQYLFSGSLDKSIKIWGPTESGIIEQIYQHDLVNGVVGFCGFQDAEEKPLLVCSCKNNRVYGYDLPSFCERGRIFSKCDTEAMQMIHQKSLNKKENSEPNQIVLKNQQKVLTSQVNAGQIQSVVEKTENCVKVRKSELNVGQTQSVLEKTDNSKSSEVNVGQSQTEKTENCMKVKTTELNVGQSQSIEKTDDNKYSEVNVDQSQSQNIENCKKRKNCENLQSDYGLSMVSQLEGHTKGVTGIVYDGSNKLFCGSKDKSIRVWDCNNGQCGNVVNFDNECRTLVKEGPWIFAGLKDMFKAGNFETQTEVIIKASGGYVNAITMYEDILFAGMEDGSILSWKVTCKTSFYEELTVLKGHTGSVLCLIIGAKKLYSGSADHTIRAWDCETRECTRVLNGHTGDVTAVICWDQFLFSGSLDKSIKIWGENESGTIEQVYQHDLVNGVVAFCGSHDSEEKPLLLCSCKDNGVYVYDLPSFCERGRIVSKCDIESIQVGPEGIFITGDTSGLIRVWKLNSP